MTSFALLPQAGPWPAPGDPAQFWPVLLACGASVLLGAAFLTGLLRRLAPGALDPAAGLSLGLSGGSLVLILVAAPALLWARAWKAELDFRPVFITLAVLLALGSAALHFRAERPPRAPAANRTALALLLLAGVLGVVRLPFVGSLLLPPYSDSVEHYLIVQDLLHPAALPGAFYTLDMTARYYHFGFHVLAAWVSSLAGASPLVVLPVLGQVLQVIIPLSLFFPVRAATHSNAAALFAVLLAGLGWRMPAFASNWGKYPALAGIATFPFALGVAWLAAYAPGNRAQRRALVALALAGGALAALVHTRSAALLALGLFSWLVTGSVLRAGPGVRILAGAAFAALLGWVAFQAAADQSLLFTFGPYLRDGFLPTLLVLLLVPFGLKHTPQATFSGLAYLLLLMLAALTPMPEFLARLGYQTLLDRPFAQTVLFLPLALIGGAGFAGLQRSLEKSTLVINRPVWVFLSCSLCLLVVLNALRIDDFRPSTCCRLVSADDLAAYAWMRTNLPPEAVLLIASEKTPTQSYGVDGGLWVAPLTGLQTKKWPHNLLLDTPETLAQVCGKGVTHIYAGGNASSFSVEVLAGRPGRYENVFSRPGASIYKVVGCQGALR